jgi:uncharacterized glyoxalase superfamily protein PhnB
VPIGNPPGCEMTEQLQLVGESLGASLTVADLARSVSRYCDVLGFSVDRRHEREGRLIGVSLRAGTVQVLLTQDNGAKGLDRTKGVGFSLQIATKQDADALAARARAAGSTLETEPMTAPHGPRIFRGQRSRHCSRSWPRRLIGGVRNWRHEWSRAPSSFGASLPRRLRACASRGDDRAHFLSHRFGYSPAFILAVCGLQFACAAVILVPRWAVWAAVALSVTAVGAAASHILIGSPLTALPAVLYTMLQTWYGITSWRREHPLSG